MIQLPGVPDDDPSRQAKFDEIEKYLGRIPAGAPQGSRAAGKSIIATSESRSNVAYGTLTTPDQVANVVLPPDGSIAVAYQATWQESAAGAGRAAIFLGANQLKVMVGAGVGANGPLLFQEAATNSASAAADRPLATGTLGLYSSPPDVADTGDATTGQVVGIATPGAPSVNSTATTVNYSGGGWAGGPCYVFAAAGTYTISIQFKASSGSVTAKNRKLWVWSLGV